MSKHEICVTDIQVWPTHNGESRVKAMATVTINESLRLSGLRIIEGKNGLFLGYPGEKRAGTDQFFNFIFPTRRELANSIQEEVLERFHQVMAAKAA